MIKKNFFLFFFFLSITSLKSQNNSISRDSLEILYDQSFDQAYSYNYGKAIATSNQIIEKALKQEDYNFATKGTLRLGSIYLNMKDTTNSYKYYRKALEYAKKTQQDSVIANAHNDLGNAYMETGGNIEKAKANFIKSIELSKSSGESEKSKLAYFVNMAWVYLTLNQPKNALPFLNRSVGIVESNPDLHPLYSINLDNLRAEYHLQKKNYSRAISLLKSTSERSKNDNYLQQIVESFQLLSKAYEANGELEKANLILKEEREFAEELNKIIRDQQLQEISAKLRLEQTENELELVIKEKELSKLLASKSNQLFKVFVITSIVLLIGFLLLLFLFKERKSNIKNLELTNKQLVASKEESERLSKLKTQFFSTISHELRTPLYGVIGLSSILLDDKKLETHKEDLKSLKFSADYLLALINDVLTLNKVDANGMKLEQNPFDLNALIKNITDSFTFSLQQNNNKINVMIDNEIPNYFIGDSVKLSQILMNLVGNANKFNENGTIDIAVKALGKSEKGHHKLHFFIKDNGIGIPKEKQKSIFEEFSQVENKNYNYQGTGLGLPIVKKLLSIFNSEIELKSEPGSGSIFSFKLEMEASKLNVENKTSLNQKTEQLLSSSFENIEILIVDDNKINQKVTQKILQSKNFNCSLADDGIQAVSMVQKNTYGLILMDIHMPNMGGIEATKAIRSFNKVLPIIALTAVEVEEMRSQILDSGMNDIILKPYDSSQFLATIYRNLTPNF